MTLRRAVVIAFLSSVTAGCSDPFAPPAGSAPFVPPGVYEVAWQDVEACSGLQGDLHRISWFLTPGVFSCTGETGQCDGLWHPPHDIYVTQFAAADSISNYRVVKHEMLHDLLGGGSNHPPVFTTCRLMPGQQP
jgi:hypothetical protein